MIIGVDAGALSISDERLHVGVWRVTFEFLKHLSRIDTKNQYRLYSFAPIPKHIRAELGANMKNIVISPPAGYMKFRLPLELMLHPVDCFLGVSQVLPFMSHGKKIGFIYDIGFLRYPEKYGTSADKLKDQTFSIAKHADDIVTITESVKEDIADTYHVDKNHIHVCYPGVSEVFKQTGKKEIKPYPYFLFVGSLWKGKNIPTLLSAFHQFYTKTSHPHHLILAGGDYWQDRDIEKTIQKFHLDQRVHLVGHVSDTQLACLYRGAAAFVIVTLTDGFCIPIVEALRSGCPVIASNIGPIAEITKDSALLVDPTKDKECYGAMKQIASNDLLRQKLRERGLETSKKYSWKVFAHDIYNVIMT